MTVTSTTCRVPYVGTNSQSVYPFSFLVFQAADIVVQTQATLTSAPITLVNGTDYVVAGLNNSSGGTITLTAGNLPTGVLLSIFRNPAQVQDTQLNEQQNYNPLTVMSVLDGLTMMVLALQDQVTRCIQIDPLDTTTPTSGVPGPPYPSCVLPPMALGLGQNILRDAGTGQFLYGTATGGGSAYLILTASFTQTVTGPVNFNNTVDFGGVVSVPTQSPGNNSTLVATTAFVTAAVTALGTTAAATYAPLASPALTGIPTVPTATPGTNTTQAASTAFVAAALANNFSALNVYTTTQNVTVPAGVSKIRARMWGAGSSGIGGAAGTVGGAGGAFVDAFFTVTPGQTLNLTIGAGGATSTGAANNGGASTIQINSGAAILTAGGGTGSTGGVPSATIGYFGINGQNGGLGVAAGAISGYVAAGPGGSSPQGGGGGPGGLAGASAGYPGVVPGGGGSSAFPGAGQLSGAGANGAITLSW